MQQPDKQTTPTTALPFHALFFLAVLQKENLMGLMHDFGTDILLGLIAFPLVFRVKSAQQTTRIVSGCVCNNLDNIEISLKTKYRHPRNMRHFFSANRFQHAAVAAAASIEKPFYSFVALVETTLTHFHHFQLVLLFPTPN